MIPVHNQNALCRRWNALTRPMPSHPRRVGSSSALNFDVRPAPPRPSFGSPAAVLALDALFPSLAASLSPSLSPGDLRSSVQLLADPAAGPGLAPAGSPTRRIQVATRRAARRERGCCYRLGERGRESEGSGLWGRGIGTEQGCESESARRDGAPAGMPGRPTADATAPRAPGPRTRADARGRADGSPPRAQSAVPAQPPRDRSRDRRPGA